MKSFSCITFIRLTDHNGGWVSTGFFPHINDQGWPFSLCSFTFRLLSSLRILPWPSTTTGKPLNRDINIGSIFHLCITSIIHQSYTGIIQDSCFSPLSAFLCYLSNNIGLSHAPYIVWATIPPANITTRILFVSNLPTSMWAKQSFASRRQANPLRSSTPESYSFGPLDILLSSQHALTRTGKLRFWNTYIYILSTTPFTYVSTLPRRDTCTTLVCSSLIYIGVGQAVKDNSALSIESVGGRVWFGDHLYDHPIPTFRGKGDGVNSGLSLFNRWARTALSYSILNQTSSFLLYKPDSKLVSSLSSFTLHCHPLILFHLVCAGSDPHIYSRICPDISTIDIQA